MTNVCPYKIKVSIEDVKADRESHQNHMMPGMYHKPVNQRTTVLYVPSPPMTIELPVFDPMMPGPVRVLTISPPLHPAGITLDSKKELQFRLAQTSVGPSIAHS
jgi:hypothetical protein